MTTLHDDPASVATSDLAARMMAGAQGLEHRVDPASKTPLDLELPILGRATGYVRKLSHKRAIEEVFFTELDMHQREEGPELTITAQLPRNHMLYSELTNGFYDLVLMAEIGRQGMQMYGHGVLDVPPGTAYVMSTSRTEITDLEAARCGSEPATLVIRVPFVKEQRSARGRVRGYALEAVGEIDGRPAVAFGGEALLIPSAIYDRARGEAVTRLPEGALQPLPIAARLVGRVAERNVVVGNVVSAEEELRCEIVTDTTHPSFFDHPLDHHAAMYLLEVARQAATLYLGARGWAPEEIVLDRCEACFTKYTALWPPASCRIVPLSVSEATAAEPEAGWTPAQQVRAHFTQEGHENGYVDLRLRRVETRVR
jgi:2-oxo-3-(phosphooxy)propyl 3-oxoalkanoate synthase